MLSLTYQQLDKSLPTRYCRIWYFFSLLCYRV